MNIDVKNKFNIAFISKFYCYHLGIYFKTQMHPITLNFFHNYLRLYIDTNVSLDGSDLKIFFNTFSSFSSYFYGLDIPKFSTNYTNTEYLQKSYLICLEIWKNSLAYLSPFFYYLKKFNIAYDDNNLKLIDMWFRVLPCIDQIIGETNYKANLNISRPLAIQSIINNIMIIPTYYDILIIWISVDSTWKDFAIDIPLRDKLYRILEGKLSVLSDNTLSVLFDQKFITFDDIKNEYLTVNNFSESLFLSFDEKIKI